MPELRHNSLPTLLSWAAVQTMGIKSCPLCSSHGPEDSPELVDHVLRHAYEFALRALPWPQPVVHELNVPPGCFTLPEDPERAEDIQQWINMAHHKSVESPGVELCDYDKENHAVHVTTNLSEYSDYFLTNKYFDDRSEDRSSRPQGDQNSASDWSTVSAQSDNMSDTVYSVTFSPDGRRVVSGSDDNTVKVWDAATTALPLILTGHGDLVRSVAFSPDSKLVASGSDDKTIRLWSAETGILQQTLKGHEDCITSVTFSPDSKLIASGSGDKTVQLWSAEISTLQSTLAGHKNQIGTLQSTLAGHKNLVKSIAFSPDSKSIVSGSYDETVKLWSAETGTLQLTLPRHRNRVNSVTFSPDGKLIASGSDRTIKLWSAKSGTLQQTLTSQGCFVTSVAF